MEFLSLLEIVHRDIFSLIVSWECSFDPIRRHLYWI